MMAAGQRTSWRAVMALTTTALGFVFACGDVELDGGRATAIPQEAGNGSAPEVVVATSASVDANTWTPRVACPLRRPNENSPCSTYGQTCEYGESPDIRCNTILTCSGGIAWTSRATETCFPRACPTAGPSTELDGTPCELPDTLALALTIEELVCPMTDGVCACTTGRDGNHEHARKWVCARPVAPCPVERPLDGQECFRHMDCDYGSCAWKGGTNMRCLDGVWSNAAGPACE